MGRCNNRTVAILCCVAALALGWVSRPAASQDVRYAVRCDPEADLVHGASIEVSSATGRPGQTYSYQSLADHDLSTNWATAHSAPVPQWVKVSFAQPETLDTVVLITRGASTIYAEWKTVQVSFDTGDPVTVQLEERAGVHIIRFDARVARWVQVTVTEDWGTRVYYGLYELMAFHDPAEEVQREIPVRERWREADLTASGRAFHPCVNLTPDDVARGRRNVATHEWAEDHAKAVIRSADTVVGKPASWVRANRPDTGAAFAYGFTGCPICSASWGTWGGANCSFDRPGTVRCRNGHVLPDASHPDPGTGYVGDDGRTHYFVGSYNAWVVETYQKWCHWLSLAYTLTGEPRYAETCAVILDALAEIYPSCDKGSWDYPSDPPSGRLNRPWYQVARVLVLLVDDYDRIHGAAALDDASFAPGLTRRENIERNLLKNGAWYCYEQSLKGGMHNGEADYIRGALSVGCLLGIDTYVDWAVDGPYGIRAMVANNADRDGGYVETSLSYSGHARDLYLTFAEPLHNYRSARYPEGLNLYDDPTFRSLYILPNLKTQAAGHWPRIGDAAPDTRRADADAPLFHEKDYAYAERLYARASDPEVRAEFGALVNVLSDGRLDSLRGIAVDREWRLFHCAEPPEAGDGLSEALRASLTETALMGQKGLAILRTPSSAAAQACVLRYGPVLNHGHLDDLNINYFALGLELTYDLGYGLGSTHTQRGWARQTASHQLVLVDERSQQPNPEVDDSGGSLHLFAGLPGLQVVDADANHVYRSLGVTTYRRFVALVGDGPGSYLLDIFRVDGGRQHDYTAHALSNDVRFTGVLLGQRAAGSVAGTEYDWGARQLNDGDMEGYPGRPYWSPPPGNGLGFLMQPRTGRPSGPWSVTWRLNGGAGYLRMTVLPEPGTDVISAWAPGIYPTQPRAEHVIVRRRSASGPLSSTFVTVREPYGVIPGVEGTSGAPGIERVARRPSVDGAVALDVHLTGGAVDRYLYAGTPARAAGDDDLSVRGSFGFTRTEGGEVRKAAVIGQGIRSRDFNLTMPRGRYTGEIVRVDYVQNLVTVDADLPTDGRLAFQTVQFCNPGYSRNTAYTVHGIYRDSDGFCVIDLGTQRTVLGVGTLDRDPISPTAMSSITPHEYANGQTRAGVDFVDGKAVVRDDGSARTRIRSMVSSAESAELTVASTEGFTGGDTFYYLDIAPGDSLVIHNWAHVDRDAEGEVRVTATDDVTLTLGGVTRYFVWGGGVEMGGQGNPDFDGSGRVDFADFVLFARAYGASAGDADYAAQYDLNADESVGFADFVLFAGHFGQSYGA